MLITTPLIRGDQISEQIDNSFYTSVNRSLRVSDSQAALQQLRRQWN